MSVGLRILIILILAAVVRQDDEFESLTRSLGADDANERELAEQRLIKLGARARPGVQKAAKSEDPEVSARAKHILRSFAPEVRMEELYEAGLRHETAAAIPNFARRLWSSEQADRIAALRDLDARGNSEDRAAFARVFTHEDLSDDVRAVCAGIMQNRQTAELAPLVVPLLERRDPQIRACALQALQMGNAKDSIPSIMPLLLNEQSAPLALNVLEMLGAQPPIHEMLDSPNVQVFSIAMAYIQKYGLKGFAREIVRAVSTHRFFTPWNAQQALVQGATWADLEPLLRAEEAVARLLALRVAIELRMPEALEAAVRLIDDDHEPTQGEAIEVILAWGGEEPASRLAKRTGPGSLVALARLGVPEARRRAVDALGSSDPSMRRAGITAIRALDAHDLTERISAMLDDSAPEVRSEAARVLPHLGGDRVGARLTERLSRERDTAVMDRLLDAVAESRAVDAAPIVLRILREGKWDCLPAAVRAAGSLRLKEAAPILVEGYVTGKPENLSGAYEALLQIRPDDLVALLRPYLEPPKEEAKKSGDTLEQENRRVESALYLLYVDPPGSKDLLLHCLKKGVFARYPVELIRSLALEEGLSLLPEEIERGSVQNLSGAGRLLAAYGRREFTDRAVTWLSSPHSEIRNQGVEYLGGLKAEEKIPEISALLSNQDQNVQVTALRALDWIEGPKAVEILRRRLAEGPITERWHAARILAGLGDRESIPQIEALLDDDNPAVRVEGVYALYILGSKDSFDRIVQAYRRGTGKTDWVWPYAFAWLGGPRGRLMVRKMWEESSDIELRKRLVSAMRSGGDFTADEIAFVEGLLDDRDLGQEAWDSLKKMAPSRAVHLLSDSRYRMSLPQGGRISNGLDEIDASLAAPLMIALLRDRDANNRSHAAQMLGRWNIAQAVEPLMRAVHSEDPQLRRAAAVALARLGDPRGLDEILRLPRSTTVAQGRMSDALFALNLVRRPIAAGRVAAVKWKREGGLNWTLRDALDEFARRSGMKLSISKNVREDGLRRPLQWFQPSWSLEEIASEWGKYAAFVVEPDGIRVLNPDEAWRFWEVWIREKRAPMRK